MATPTDFNNVLAALRRHSGTVGHHEDTFWAAHPKSLSISGPSLPCLSTAETKAAETGRRMEWYKEVAGLYLFWLPKIKICLPWAGYKNTDFLLFRVGSGHVRMYCMYVCHIVVIYLRKISNNIKSNKHEWNIRDSQGDFSCIRQKNLCFSTAWRVY